MCGICGVLGPVDRNVVERMVAALHHRGPDDSGVYYDAAVAIGMARLSIIDLTAAAHQPMSSPDGKVWIVYNGEVYNFQSERAALEKRGYTFGSHSDTEVVLRLYEHYGDKFLVRLRGMFALAIYDARRGAGRERLLLARDQLGIKPLLFARTDKHLVFASELKALLASGLVSREIDRVALRTLLTYGSVYQPRTLLRGVSMLPPAHYLVMANGRLHIERYWSLGVDQRSALRRRPYEEQVEELSAVLEESVRLHMVSDVPVGAFLSGGVDSSLLVGLMTRIAGKRVKTFSVGFGAEGAALDESHEAERTARFLGADHTHVLVRGDDMREHLPRIIRGLDQPSVNGVNSYFVSLAARQAVTVAISGTGGDEIFAGYPWFAEMALFHKADGSGTEVDSGLSFLLARAPFLKLLLPRFWRAHGKYENSRENFLLRYARTFQIFGHGGAVALLDPSFGSCDAAEDVLVNDIVDNDELASGEVVERVTALCLRGYTCNQLLRDIDATSMAHSLEVRVPFLDVPLIETALSLPVSAKLGNLSEGINPYTATYRETGSKKILIDVGKRLNILPEEIACQPKRGFTFPVDTWLKGSMWDIVEDALSPRTTAQRGFFRPAEVEKVMQDFLKDRTHWTRPWLLTVFELWCRTFLDTGAES
jgi:asparagine synthase (glutamine-hydrolysing)